MGSGLTSVRSILGLKPDPAIDNLPPGGGAAKSKATSSRARSSRRIILNQDQRLRLDGVTLPVIQNDLCESAYDAGAIGFIAKFLVQTTLPHRRQPGPHYTRTDGRFTLRITDVAGAGLPFGSYLCEIKRASEVAAANVQKKAQAATQWCERASSVSDKPWRYVLIPHDEVQINRTFAAVVN